ncbi:MAG: sigma-70 family RNA polymerase sigma factor [Alistipes sp.]|nr:sigma-70 family RNA polymerase sigma factor [Alistipes sp.]
MEGFSNIVRRCRAGDRDAQMRFYSLFCNKVFGSSLRILGDRMEAEEVMQESILKVLTKTELLNDDPGIMEAVLRRIAINHSIDLCRRRRLELVELSPRHDRLEEEEPDTAAITMADVRRAMENLPQGCRIILNLKLVEGYDNEEIAEILDVSDSAVRSQYSRARRKLAEELKKKKDMVSELEKYLSENPESFGQPELPEGHAERFLARLEQQVQPVAVSKRRGSFARLAGFVGLAASIALLLLLVRNNRPPTLEDSRFMEAAAYFSYELRSAAEEVRQLAGYIDPAYRQEILEDIDMLSVLATEGIPDTHEEDRIGMLFESYEAQVNSLRMIEDSIMQFAANDQ